MYANDNFPLDMTMEDFDQAWHRAMELAAAPEYDAKVQAMLLTLTTTGTTKHQEPENA